MLSKKSLMELGRSGVKRDPDASTVRSVASTARKTSRSVSGETCIRRLIPLKYPSIAFVLSSAKTSASTHSTCLRERTRAMTRCFLSVSWIHEVVSIPRNANRAGKIGFLRTGSSADGTNESSEFNNSAVNVVFFVMCGVSREFEKRRFGGLCPLAPHLPERPMEGRVWTAVRTDVSAMWTQQWKTETLLPKTSRIALRCPKCLSHMKVWIDGNEFLTNSKKRLKVSVVLF